MSGIGRMIAVSSQPDGLVQAPAPSFGCREVAHQHTHACNPGVDPHGAADTQVAESSECREGANGRSHPARARARGRPPWLGSRSEQLVG